MSLLFINQNCIACDACRDICPTQSINIGETIYIIDSDLCVRCTGYFASPYCIDVCPVDAIEDTKE